MTSLLSVKNWSQTSYSLQKFTYSPIYPFPTPDAPRVDSMDLDKFISQADKILRHYESLIAEAIEKGEDDKIEQLDQEKRIAYRIVEEKYGVDKI